MILTRQQKLFRGNGSAPSARAIADSVISALTPAAWYRNATDVISSGGFASIWADYASSDKGLVLPGASGNYASLADGANVQFGTVSLELCCRVQINDWTPSTARFLSVKANAYFAPSWYIANATGMLVYQCRISGLDKNIGSGVAPPLSDGEWAWLRITHVFATGKVNFYYAADSEAVPSSWTQVGSEQTTDTGAPTDAVSTFGIGGNSGLNVTDGIIKRFLYYKDGAVSVDADFTAQELGATSFTESSSNAATVTINTSGASPAHIGKARDLLQGTGTNQPAYAAGVFTFDGVDNFLRTSAIAALTNPVTQYAVIEQGSWTTGEFMSDGASVVGRQFLRQASTTPEFDISGGSTPNTDLAVGAFGIVCAVWNGAASSHRVNNNAKIVVNVVSVYNGLTIGARYDNAIPAHVLVKEWVVFNAAHDDATQSSVITALNDALTVF